MRGGRAEGRKELRRGRIYGRQIAYGRDIADGRKSLLEEELRGRGAEES